MLYSTNSFLASKIKMPHLIHSENFELVLLSLSHSSNSMTVVLTQDVLLFTTTDDDEILKGRLKKTHVFYCWAHLLIIRIFVFFREKEP